MSSCTKGNLNKGLLINIHLALQKSHVEKLGYTKKFQEAVQSSNVVSSMCFQVSILTIFKTLFTDTINRDQTILSFEENLIEDVDEIKKKVFRENN